MSDKILSNIYIQEDGLNLDMLLVSPSLDWKYSFEQKMAMRIDKSQPNQETPNVGCAYIIAKTKSVGLRVKYVDMVTSHYSVEELVEYAKRTKPSIVGFSCFTIQVKSAATIAAKIKEVCPDTLICIRGPHAIAIPVQCLNEFPSFDFIVTGEAENIIIEIIESAGNIDLLSKIPGVVTRKNKTSFIPAQFIQDLGTLPYPAWEEYDLSKYPGTYPHRTKLELPMVSGRGCPYSCTFCCKALGSRMRRRTWDNIMGEIERNVEEFGCESIAFLDETFVLSQKQAYEFCNEMIRRDLHKKVTWSCSMRVSGNSQELFHVMRKAGCYYIFFGLESANEETLKRIRKAIKIKQMVQTVDWVKQAGIIPVGAFIIGLEGTDELEVYEAIELGKKLDLYSITFPIAVPFPGTQLRNLAQAGKYGLRILSDDWDLYGKQDPGVMDTEMFSHERRKELQKIAYSHFPKKKIANYFNLLKNYVSNGELSYR